MLNSYAENELMPFLTKPEVNGIAHNDGTTSTIPTHTNEKSFLDKTTINNNADNGGNKNANGNGNQNSEKDIGKHENENIEHDVNLEDRTILLEKNKYFPILQQDLFTSRFDRSLINSDTKEEEKLNSDSLYKNIKDILYKPKYLSVEKASLKKFFQYVTDKYPIIQKSNSPGSAAIDEDNNANTNEDTARITQIRDIFKSTFNLYSNFAFGYDEVKPLSKQAINNGNGLAKTLLGSTDMLYLLGMEDEIASVLDFISSKRFGTTKTPILNIFENVVYLVGSLISAYEMSNETKPIFLDKAKHLADFSLRAFDTPNFLPLTDLPWRSPLNNRFPFQSSNFKELSGLGLEYIKLSQLLKDNSYYSSIYPIYETIDKSKKNVFDIDYLFPNTVDASGCSLLSNKDMQNGVHLGSNVMKSIHNGDFVFCKQSDTLLPDNFQKIQYYSVNHNEEKMALNFKEAKNSNYYFLLMKMYHLLNANEDKLNFVSQYVNAVEKIKGLMVFKPILPYSDIYTHKNISLISNLKTVSTFNPMSNEILVKVKQTLQMDQSNCQVASMLALSGKLLNDESHLRLAEEVLNGCIELSKIPGSGGVFPSNVVLEKCYEETNNDCTYNKEKKIKSIFMNEDNSKSDDESIFGFTGIKINGDENSNGFNNLKKRTWINKRVFVDKDKDNTDDDHGNDNSRQKNNNIDNKQQIISHQNVLGADADDDDDDDDGLTPKPPKKTYSIGTEYPKSFTKENVDATEGKWINKPDIPFFLNDASTDYFLYPEIPEALFYMYRITGDPKWRKIGGETFDNMIKVIQQRGPKGTIDISSLSDVFNKVHSDDLPHYWFTQTLKYYYLLFADHSVLSLDDYVFSSDGHPFKKVKIINNNLMKNYDIAWDLILDDD
ncbi:uncharacterized protein SCODWIG_02093 [Saccharomycodes ludwigii]|uniref:alpha-1,2-Mannosidase n=1 Tax=Saccharomycodes ludwigii TaxID=36035 RepID=A0A376B6Q9_9ASCO|nr:uncharacterized protein SCODWIG_02093 [Saccharomycodes ludwigii]